MRTILAATDLSPRSESAIDRAALLAKQFRSKLILLHAVDGDQPKDLAARTTVDAREALSAHTSRIAAQHDVCAEPVVANGTVFEAIIAAGRRRRADLIVMGKPRQSVLRDVFSGTTVERVMRAGDRPVLMVNTLPQDAYKRTLIATDLSDASARAAQVARSLGLLARAQISVVHAFRSHTRGLLTYIGAGDETVNQWIADEALTAGRELRSFLVREGFDRLGCRIVLEKGEPSEAILNTIERLQSDLLVIGTRGEAALRRILLGSLAADILRHAQCDVLAVPPESPFVAERTADPAPFGLSSPLDSPMYELGI